MYTPSFRPQAALRRPLFKPLIVSALALMALPGCTLLAVGSVVGKGFAPALAKGDKEALKSHSTDRLAGYWDVFTEDEIKAAVGADRAPTKPGRRRPKGPRIRLDSFKTHGHTAELVVRRGSERFRFLCHRTAGGWKVADVFFHMRGKPRQLSRMLQALVAAKTLQRGLETGSRYLLHNVSTPAFRAAVLSQIKDAELRLLSSAAPTAPQVPAPPKTERARSRIESEVTSDGALVRVTGGALNVEIRLVDTEGQFAVDGVSLRLGDAWHRLGDLLAYLGPALELVRWAMGHLGPESPAGPPSDAALRELSTHLRGLFTREVGEASLGWLTPRDLKLLPWDRLRAFLPLGRRPGRDDGSETAPDKNPEESASLGPKAVTRLEKVGDTVHLEAEVGDHRMGLQLGLEGGAWRIRGAWLEQKRSGPRTDLVALLSALGPLANLGLAASRLVPEVFEGETRGRAALRAILDALRAGSSADANRRLWSLVPKGFVGNLPLAALPQDLRALLPGSPPGPDRKPPRDAILQGGAGEGPSPAPRLALVEVRQTPDSLMLHLLLAGRDLRLELVMEAGGWKLDDVHLPLAGQQRSLKDVGGLLIPAMGLAQAVFASDAEALRLAMAPDLRREVVDPLLGILGRRFRSLMATVRQRLLPQTPVAPAKTSPPAAQTDTGKPPQARGFRLEPFTLDSSAGRASLGLVFGSGVTLGVELVRDPDGRWGIQDLRFPLAGREVTLGRAGPVLGPILGFGLSLLAGDLGGVRRASSSGFNAAAWRRMTPARFQKLVTQISSGGGAKTAKAGPRGPGRGAPASSPAPRFVALRIQDRVRWPWAQVELDVGGRRILAALVKERGQWKVHDLELQIGALRMSVKKLIALGF